MVNLILISLVIGQTILSWLWKGPFWLGVAEALFLLVLLGAGLFQLFHGRLEWHVNLLALVCLLECLLYFDNEVSRQFFVLCLFSMVNFAILAVRPYQRVFGFLVFPVLVGTKGLFEFYQADQGVLSRSTGQETLVTLLIFGAAIPLVQFLMDIMSREIRHSEILLEANRHLNKVAGTDRLTGTWNRRHFELLARRETGEAIRNGKPLALALLDLDRFKQVNDRWGHQAGDEVLTEVVRTIMRVLRKGDSLIRWGGDEFVALCPGVGKS